MVRDTGRYYRVDSAERARLQGEWNRPVWWPMILIGLVLIAGIAWGRHAFRRRERLNARGEVVA